MMGLTGFYEDQLHRGWAAFNAHFSGPSDIPNGSQSGFSFISAANAQASSRTASIAVNGSRFEYQVSGPSGFAANVASMLTQIGSAQSGARMLAGLSGAGWEVRINYVPGVAQAGTFGCFLAWFCDGTQIQIDPTFSAEIAILNESTGARGRRIVSGAEVLAHELYHAWQASRSGAPKIGQAVRQLGMQSTTEPFAVRYTNRIRRELGYEYVRTDYHGVDLREY